jgi:hypothetical protein
MHQSSPGAVVVRVPDPVEDRVAHQHVRRRHVDAGAQHVRAVGELAGAHAAEQVQALRARAVAERRRPARLRDRAAASRISSWAGEST